MAAQTVQTILIFVAHGERLMSASTLVGNFYLALPPQWLQELGA